MEQTTERAQIGRPARPGSKLFANLDPRDVRRDRPEGATIFGGGVRLQVEGVQVARPPRGPEENHREISVHLGRGRLGGQESGQIGGQAAGQGSQVETARTSRTRDGHRSRTDRGTLVTVTSEMVLDAMNSPRSASSVPRTLG